jgi:hypothetical protein
MVGDTIDRGEAEAALRRRVWDPQRATSKRCGFRKRRNSTRTAARMNCDEALKVRAIDAAMLQ